MCVCMSVHAHIVCVCVYVCVCMSACVPGVRKTREFDVVIMQFMDNRLMLRSPVCKYG